MRILLQNAFNSKVKFQLGVDLPSLPEDYPLSYTGKPSIIDHIFWLLKVFEKVRSRINHTANIYYGLLYEERTIKVTTQWLYYKPPVDLYLSFEKSSWKNQVRWTGFLAFKNQFRNWFFQTTQAVKIKFKIDEKSSLSNWIFPNWFFRHQVEINRGKVYLSYDWSN